jgi:hypothetical protein
LNAGSNIRDFTQCQLLLTLCSAHLPNNDQFPMYAYTDGELDAFGLLQPLIQVFHGSKHT